MRRTSRGGAVRAVVIDVDRLPGDAGQRRLQLGDHRRDIGALVEGRDDDAQDGRVFAPVLSAV